MDDDLCFTQAVELARLLHSRELSARELLDAFLNRIHRINPQLNAIVTLAEERAAEAGLQLVGRYGTDDRLLSIAGAVARVLLPAPPRPPAPPEPPA